MMRKIALVSFLVFLNISVAGDQLDEQKIFDSFKNYTEKVYLKNFNRDRLQIAGLFGNIDQLSVRVLGYSLGNLLRYARRGEKNHKTWLILERKLKEGIFAETEQFGKQNGQDQAWIEKRQKRFWDECVAAQLGMFDADMFYWTNVHPKKAPNFFELLEKGDSAWAEPDTTDEDKGREVEKKIEDSGPVSDEILGVWTWTGEEYKDPSSGRKVRRKLVVDVRRASTERSASGSEAQRKYFYEGYVVAIENLIEMNRPLASPGQLCWKISYTGPDQPVSSDVLVYILDSTIDRMGAFKIRLLRKENVLEIGLVKYYR